MMGGVGTRVAELKLAVERQKTLVAKLQEQQASLNDGSFRHGHWNQRRNLRQQKEIATAKLRELKSELARVSGMTSDPRIDLLVRAHHLLDELADRGVDIGLEGEAIIDGIEFIVSAKRLTEPKNPSQSHTSETMSKTSRNS